MLVHNGVLSDARVTKEARTLRAAGHIVEIHGIAGNNHAQRHILANSDIEVTLHSRVDTRDARAHPPWWLQTSLIAGLSIILTLFTQTASSWIAAVQMSHSLSTAITLGFVTTLVTLGYFLRPAIRKGIAIFRTAIYIIATRAPEMVSKRFAAFLVRIAHSGYKSTTKALVLGLAERPAPDIIHLHDHVALLAAAELRSAYNVPIVWDAHEIYEDLAAGDRGRSATNRAIIQLNTRYIDAFITINDSIADFYRRMHPGLPEAVVVMNAAYLEPGRFYDGRLHEAAGIPRSQRVLLFQGGLGPKRGLHELIVASKQFAADWSLVVMGWGSIEAELRELAARNQRDSTIPSCVFLPGVPQHELQAWSAGASLGAIPYESTGLNHLYCTPNKLWEYPAADVPILCTNLQELRKFVTAHKIGFLLPAKFSADDIANTDQFDFGRGVRGGTAQLLVIRPI